MKKSHLTYRSNKNIIWHLKTVKGNYLQIMISKKIRFEFHLKRLKVRDTAHLYWKDIPFPWSVNTKCTICILLSGAPNSWVLNTFSTASHLPFEVPTRVPNQTIDETEKAKLLENLVRRETCSRPTENCQTSLVWDASPRLRPN